MDFNSLTAAKGSPGSIAGWVNYSDTKLPLADILADAQSLIYERLRVKDMQGETALAVPAGVVAVARPAGILTTVEVRDQFYSQLRALTPESLRRMRSIDGAGNFAQGQPTRVAEWDNAYQFDCALSVAAGFTVLAYKVPAALGPGNLTNFLTDKHPALLRTACLVVAADFLNDDGKYQRYTTRFGTLLQSAAAQDDMSLLGMQEIPEYT